MTFNKHTLLPQLINKGVEEARKAMLPDRPLVHM